MSPFEIKDFIESLMWKMWGRPYIWGGDDPMQGFDCSGGVQEILRSLGAITRADPPDMTAATMMALFSVKGRGQMFSPSHDDLTTGDLLFFGKPSVTHVAMAYNDWLMFEFGGGGSKTTSVDAAIKQNAYGRFRPIENRSDLVGIIRPLALFS